MYKKMKVRKIMQNKQNEKNLKKQWIEKIWKKKFTSKFFGSLVLQAPTYTVQERGGISN
jgi:hypothetical protein